MRREADYSIKGFLYQFNLTLLKLLEDKNDSEIIVEGIVEDIDLISEGNITAIQCKYHETKEKYKLSDLYKPILQMMVNFSKGSDKNIEYILYAFFNNEAYRQVTIGVDELKMIFNTENKDYICKYISKIMPPQDNTIEEIIMKTKISEAEKMIVAEYYKKNIDILNSNFDITKFNSKFKIILGKSFNDLCEDIKSKMADSDLSKEDVEDLFYPNAIQKIADLSINHDVELRKIKKSILIKELKNNKKTAVSRWTRELRSYNSLMKKRREQIKCKLNSNNKRIHLVIDSQIIENFDDDIVNFISNYNGKYNFKIKLHDIPLFCIDNHGVGIAGIESRLYKKNIKFENGIRGEEFFKEVLLRQPQKKVMENWREFDIRICEYNGNSIEAINSLKADIMFIVNKDMYKTLDVQDIDIEKLYVTSFKELEYLLSITSTLD